MPHFELLSLVEGKASVSDLLTPASCLEGVAHHLPLVTFSIEAGVQVKSDVLRTVTNVDGKSIKGNNIIRPTSWLLGLYNMICAKAEPVL